MCGSPDIPLHLLKSVATYKGIEPSASLIQWFWEVMESFSNTERSLFLRFVWGRTRLPRTIADFRGRDFVIQVRLQELHDSKVPLSHAMWEMFIYGWSIENAKLTAKYLFLLGVSSDISSSQFFLIMISPVLYFGYKQNWF